MFKGCGDGVRGREGGLFIDRERLVGVGDTVRYALGRSTSPMAVAAYTYDQLTTADRALVPAEDQLTAALDALPDDTE